MKSEEVHKSHLKIVLGKLKAARIALNQSQCMFFKKKIKILGNILTEGKVVPDSKKVEAIKNYAGQNTISELRSIIGLANYLREYIPMFAEKIAPLSDLLKGATKKVLNRFRGLKILKNLSK